MKPVLEQIKESLLAEAENTGKFRNQLGMLLEANQPPQLLERIGKGRDYYRGVLWPAVKILLRHLEEMKKQKRVKQYVSSLTDLDQLFAKKLEEVDKALYLTEAILEGRDHFDFKNLTDERALERAKMLDEIRSQVGTSPIREKKPGRAGRSKKRKKDEPSTFDVTLKLLESGLAVEAIAKERGLVIGTIEGHLAKAVEEGRISVLKFMSEENVNIITAALKEMPEGFTSKDLYAKLSGKYGYGQLRAVMNHVGIKSTRKKEEE